MTGSLDDPQTLNSYGYALNNPVGNTDPTGRDAGVNNPVYSGYWNPPAEAIPGNPVVDTATYAAALWPAIYFGGVPALIHAAGTSILAAGSAAYGTIQELLNSGAAQEITQTPSSNTAYSRGLGWAVS